MAVLLWQRFVPDVIVAEIHGSCHTENRFYTDRHFGGFRTRNGCRHRNARFRRAAVRKQRSGNNDDSHRSNGSGDAEEEVKGSEKGVLKGSERVVKKGSEKRE